ncbi:hypothetical protein ABPG72_008033 [Tetrahymena utriculariae]
MKIFIDWISQPSRAVVTYCLIENIPHEIIQIKVNALEHRKPEYIQINPSAKVPAISDRSENGEIFNLFESHTIMRYLADRYNKSKLYPKDNIQLRALTNSYLDWHHTNTRKCGVYLFDVYSSSVLGIQPKNNIELLYAEIEAILKFIDQFWLLEGKNKFIANNIQLTIADISCYCEVSQMIIDSYDFKNKTPNLYNWMKRMEEIPEIQQTHKILFKLAPKMSQNKIKPNL